MQDQINAPIMNNLQNVFTFAFIETATYHFVFPKPDQYMLVNMPGKLCRCLSCNEITEVRFNHDGAVHIRKDRLEGQRQIYQELGLKFPAVEQGEPLIYQQTGYCEKCSASRLQRSEQAGQVIYPLCRSLYELDRQFGVRAGGLIDHVVRNWLKTRIRKHSVGDELCGCGELLSRVILKDEAVIRHVQEYQLEVNRLAGQARDCLSGISASRFTAFVGRPLNIYESMADDIYNEYTVVFPDGNTPAREFYVETVIIKDRVHMFLEQNRIDSPEGLLRELGFDDQWITALAQPMATIE